MGLYAGNLQDCAGRLGVAVQFVQLWVSIRWWGVGGFFTARALSEEVSEPTMANHVLPSTLKSKHPKP